MSDADSEKKSTPRIGAILAGKYEVERVLGAGAMGVVVAARHRLLRQTVALKLISGSRETRSNAVARFTREARAIAGLASDHVVRILDFGLLDEGTPFMVMQYLPGRDLASEVLARGGKLPQVEAVDHVIHACAGLAVAHAAGIVHRDIKPSNLLLTARASGEPLVVIVDFGISKTLKESEEELSLTVSQTTLGSPLYMSPEQIRDPKTVDARTDIWSLGVVLRFLLTGKPAFSAREASGVLAAVIADEPAPLRADAPEVAAGLEDVVLRCLEKKPAFRFESAAELAQALIPYASEAGAALARTIPGARVGSMPSLPRPGDAPDAALAARLDAGTFASMTRGPGPSARPPARQPARRRAAIGFGAAIACAAVAATGMTLRESRPRLEESAAVGPPDAASLPIPESRTTTTTSGVSAPEVPDLSSATFDAGPSPPRFAPRRPRPIHPPISPLRGASVPPSGPVHGGADAVARAPDAPSDPLDTAK